MYDPATGKFTLISTCFPTHHLIFAEDANNTLWVSSGGAGPASSAGSTARCSEETGDERKRRAGRRSSSTPTATASATTMSSPTSRSIRRRTSASDRLLQRGGQPDGRLGVGTIARPIPGRSCASIRTTQLTEIYEPPSPGYGPRGGDIGRDGVYWASLASGHLGKFDRSNARCSTGRPQPASTARRAGRSIIFPGRSSRM